MKLKLVLGPVQLVFYSVGIIIGAGVYSVVGAAAGSAQRSLWASFIVAAVVALLTGLPESTVVGYRGEIHARIAQRLPALQSRARQTNELLTQY
jgi:hypothetical protein